MVTDPAILCDIDSILQIAQHMRTCADAAVAAIKARMETSVAARCDTLEVETIVAARSAAAVKRGAATRFWSPPSNV